MNFENIHFEIMSFYCFVFSDFSADSPFGDIIWIVMLAMAQKINLVMAQHLMKLCHFLWLLVFLCARLWMSIKGLSKIYLNSTNCNYAYASSCIHRSSRNFVPPLFHSYPHKSWLGMELPHLGNDNDDVNYVIMNV